MVDIKGLDKERVLKALYDNSHAKGTGFFQTVPSGIVTVEHCENLLKSTTNFDYLYGRVLKIDIGGDAFDERLYDRDCGEGAAQRAVDSIRAEPKDGGDADKGAEENPNMKKTWEQAELCSEAEKKILEIVKELPGPAQMALCIGLAEKFTTLASFAVLMMHRPATPPLFRTFDIPADREKKRDIGPFPFPHDIFSMGRNG